MGRVTWEQKCCGTTQSGAVFTNYFWVQEYTWDQSIFLENLPINYVCPYKFAWSFKWCTWVHTHNLNLVALSLLGIWWSESWMTWVQVCSWTQERLVNTEPGHELHCMLDISIHFLELLADGVALDETGRIYRLVYSCSVLKNENIYSITHFIFLWHICNNDNILCEFLCNKCASICSVQCSLYMY